jgi:hypothetical protein
LYAALGNRITPQETMTSRVFASRVIDQADIDHGSSGDESEIIDLTGNNGNPERWADWENCNNDLHVCYDNPQCMPDLLQVKVHDSFLNIQGDIADLRSVLGVCDMPTELLQKWIDRLMAL